MKNQRGQLTPSPTTLHGGCSSKNCSGSWQIGRHTQPFISVTPFSSCYLLSFSFFFPLKRFLGFFISEFNFLLNICINSLAFVRWPLLVRGQFDCECGGNAGLATTYRLVSLHFSSFVHAYIYIFVDIRDNAKCSVHF